MSDTTKHTLSLEEELDVLEAVYKVGKEKGLDLLRPEQIKKLVDAGRIPALQTTFITNEHHEIEPEREPLNLTGRFSEAQAKFLVMGLKVKLKIELDRLIGDRSVWDGMTQAQINFAHSCYFTYVYGVDENQLVENLVGK